MSNENQRKIIHVDMDAFYASVEIRDDPSLRGRPVVVGGSPEGRGVVAAASYEARVFGIHSAMPASRAVRLCPHLVFLRPDFGKYKEASRIIREIFHRYTDLVEPVSLDEAYLDVTVNKPGNPSATRIAREIKGAILAETALTASAGVSVNKFLAKVASEEKKPDGLFVIRPGEVERFLRVLALEKVPGIGAITRRAFAELGIHTCGDLRLRSLAELTELFGKRGSWFYRLARGEDNRPVSAHHTRKSISVEDTFPRDHDDPDWLMGKLAELAERLAQRAEKAGVKGRTIILKLKLADFNLHTRSLTLPEHTAERARLLELGRELFKDSGLSGRPLRLLGLGLAQLDNREENRQSGREPLPHQLELPLGW